jgi:hypothetical protein
VCVGRSAWRNTILNNSNKTSSDIATMTDTTQLPQLFNNITDNRTIALSTMSVGYIGRTTQSVRAYHKVYTTHVNNNEQHASRLCLLDNMLRYMGLESLAWYEYNSPLGMYTDINAQARTHTQVAQTH